MRSYVTDESQPPPRPVNVVIICDGHHGLFPPPRLEFAYDGRDHPWTIATRAGWTIVPERDLCPECRR